MPSLKDIRARIDSTKNTQQITKAMKLVSAAKLRKAQNNIVNMRPYALTLRKMISDLALSNNISHPLMEKKPEVNSVLLVVISSDRGLCGAFNGNVNKYVENYLKVHKEKYKKIDIIFVGRKGYDFFARRGVKSLDYITRLDRDISYPLASKVSQRLMKVYLSSEYEEIQVIYNEFKSAIAQSVIAETILPVDLNLSSFTQNEEAGVNYSKDFVYEVPPKDILGELLSKHFDLQIYRAMSESVAAEHGARMTAMENASNNARDMINGLTLTYNKLRQEKITKELIEIVSGAEALK